KCDRGITPHGMAYEGNRFWIAAVVEDRLVGNAAPHQIGINARRYAGAIDPPRQLVHAARKDEARYAAEQVGTSARRGHLLGGWQVWCCRGVAATGNGDRFDRGGSRRS